MREEVDRQVARIAPRFVAAEVQGADQSLAALQRQQRDAGQAASARKEQLVVRGSVRPEPGAAQRTHLRRQRQHAVGEDHVRESLRAHPRGTQQVAQLMLRIVQDQRRGREPFGPAQLAGQQGEQLRQRRGIQQLELALLQAVEGRLIVQRLVADDAQALLQVREFVHATRAAARSSR